MTAKRGLFALLAEQRRFIYLAFAVLSGAGIWAAFQLPSAIYPELTFSRIGTKSMTARYRAFRPLASEPAAVAHITTACVDMATFKPTPIPDSLRKVFERHPAYPRCAS